MAEDPSDQEATLCCDHCNAKFKRKEHLTRHSRRHSGLKPFSCTICRKLFSRRDTLLRHLTTHGLDPSEVPQEQGNPTGRARLACRQCAQSKQRCSGNVPCDRCVTKGKVCQPASRSDDRERQNTNSSVLSRDETPMPPSSPVLKTTTVPAGINTPYRSHLPCVGALADQPSVTMSNQYFHSDFPLPQHHLHHIDPIIPPNHGFLTENTDLATLQFDTMQYQFDDNSYPLDTLWLAAETDFTPSSVDISNQFPQNRTAQGNDAAPASTSNNDAIFGSSPTNEFHRPQYRQPQMSILQDQSTCRSFSPMTFEDSAIVAAENFGTIKRIPPESFSQIAGFYAEQRRPKDAVFIDAQLFHSFVELYFEYFHQNFAFLHPAILETPECPWVLLLAAAAAGSQYSGSAKSIHNARVLLELLQRAIRIRISCAEDVDLSLIQSIHIRDTLLLFAGEKRCYLSLLYERSILATVCRNLDRSESGLLPHDQCGAPTTDELLSSFWLRWLRRESFLRLVYSVRFAECLQLALFDLPPIVSRGDFPSASPGDESLWKCKTAEEWNEQHSKSQAQTAPPGSNQQNSRPVFTESLMKMVRFTDIYVEERLTLERLRHSSFYQSAWHSLLTASQGDASAPSTQIDVASICSAVVRVAEAEIQKHCPSMVSEGNSNTEDSLPYLILILRQVRLKALYSFSGWQATKTQMATAKDDLRNWMASHETSARQCLSWAASILGMLRNKAYFASYDALSLLAAVLYIWAYDGLVIGHSLAPSDSRTPNLSTTTLRLHHVASQGAVRSWIDEGGEVSLHIPGVGILDGAESSVRLLVEFQRILLTRASWPSICRGLAKNVSQVLQGQQPRFDDD